MFASTPDIESGSAGLTFVVMWNILSRESALTTLLPIVEESS